MADILNPLRRRRQRAQNESRRHERKARWWKRRTAKIHARILRIRARRSPERLRETVALDGTPVFRGIALVLLDARANGWKGRLNSADRREGVAERFGKFSQAKLYACSQNCRSDCHGNCNPANPPGRSSHELRGDGVVGDPGAHLLWWQLGLDTSDADTLRSVLNDLGYGAIRPYADAREWHHTNLRRNPRARLIERGRI